MRYTIETEIDSPIATVSTLVGDPSRWEEWLEGIVSYEHVGGTPGMPGATSRLEFDTAGSNITMHGTVLSRDLPDEFRQTMEAPHVLITITTRLESLSPETTKYISEQEYEFRGLKNKLLGVVMRRPFKKQTKRHVENLKQLAER